MPQKKYFNVALCGIGRMGSIHLENIIKSTRIQLQYIVEVDLEKAKQVVENMNIDISTKLVHFDDIQNVLSDTKVDGIIIATPTKTHEVLVKAAISSGKHVLCEKPLALHLNEVMFCYDLAKNKGLVLLCAFNRRFDPQIQELVSRSKNDIGKLYTIKICSRDSPKPSINYLKTSGGIFHDCIVHDMDIARWIVGENPQTIYVAAHCNDPEIAKLDDVDTVIVTMKFPCGVLLNMEAQRNCAYGYHQTVEIYGSKGNMLSGNPRRSSLMTNGCKVLDNIHYSFKERYADAYRHELDHFVDLALKNIEVPFICDVDTLCATLLCYAAEESLKENRIIDVKNHFEKTLKSNGLSDLIGII